VPAAPDPWPTTLIATEAIPLLASVPATAHGAPFFESVNPWPKIANGPAARRGCPAREEQRELQLFRRLHRGRSGQRATAGMTASAFS